MVQSSVYTKYCKSITTTTTTTTTTTVMMMEVVVVMCEGGEQGSREGDVDEHVSSSVLSA